MVFYKGLQKIEKDGSYPVKEMAKEAIEELIEKTLKLEKSEKTEYMFHTLFKEIYPRTLDSSHTLETPIFLWNLTLQFIIMKEIFIKS